MNLDAFLAYAGYVGWRELVLALLILTPLEHLLPLHAKALSLRRGWVVDMAHFFLSGIFIRLGLLSVILVAAAIGTETVPASWREAVHSQPLFLQVFAATLIADLGFYLSHRAMHHFPVLWRFHAVHHSSEEMDWLAAYRVHPVDQVLVKGASLLPIYILGFSAGAIIVSSFIYHWQALLIHSNIRLPLGPFRFLIVGPAFHHWHHANERDARDKNFSGQLPLWDMVFRTLHLPDRLPASYGVDEAIPNSWMGQMAYPFRRKSPAVSPRENEAVETS